MYGGGDAAHVWQIGDAEAARVQDLVAHLNKNTLIHDHVTAFARLQRELEARYLHIVIDRRRRAGAAASSDGCTCCCTG